MTSLAATERIPSAGWRGGLQTLKVGSALTVAGALFGLLAGSMVMKGKPQEIVVLAVVLLPVAIWKRPHIGPVVLLCAALLLEQVAVTADTDPSAAGAIPVPVWVPITGHTPFFAGLSKLHLDPSDLVLLMIAIIYLLRTDVASRGWPRSHLSRALRWLMGAIIVGIIVGEMHHGSFRIALQQARPFIYLYACFMLTAVLIRTRSALQTVLWAFVIATALKAAQGVFFWVTVASHMHPRPDSVVGHEAAYFFAVFMFLVACLWVFNVPGQLRKTATWLLPLIIIANLVNDRRAAWLVLGGGLITLAAIAYARLPERRRMLRKTGIVLLGISVIYFPLYWNKAGALAQPAMAVRSQFSPNARDAASDLYRQEEDANLLLNIHNAGPLGRGLGVDIDYALQIVDLSKTDPSIKYIPHNGVLYIPEALGLLGVLAMWSVIGTAIVAGCRLSKSEDRELAVVGALVTCSMVGWVLEGATDMGFTFYRIAFVTGVLLGLLETARRLQLAARSVQPAPD